ncbi:hypothetical protein CK203_026801 [Vitis vinifera]|uniref:Uncharacterized protein n=1 Tax=Vitis vinifera TaxID=29760 RepID=A0A438IP44_VITVI|nr:hypothetical protein CK203_026801 [Vitis vinifera]
MADTREGWTLIEQGMGKGLEDLREQIQDLREGVLGSQVQSVSHEEFMSFQDKVMTMFASVESRMEAWLHAMDARDQEIRQELAIYKTAVSARVMATHEAPRVEVPKPHTFSGKRDAKELDNFLWHMERYFEAIALMMKPLREIKRQFYPEDVAYLARKSLKRLKHTGSIRGAVVQLHGQLAKLGRARVEETWCPDLATAMAVAESLGIIEGRLFQAQATIQGNQAKVRETRGHRATLLRRIKQRPQWPRMAKARTSERSSRPGPIASCVMVRTGHGTALREGFKCYDRGEGAGRRC